MKSASRSNRNLGRFAIGKALSESALHVHERHAAATRPNAADDEAEGRKSTLIRGRPTWSSKGGAAVLGAVPADQR